MMFWRGKEKERTVILNTCLCTFIFCSYWFVGYSLHTSHQMSWSSLNSPSTQLGGPGFKFSQDTNYSEFFHGFPESIHSVAGTVLFISPQPLHSTSFPTDCSLILSFGTVQSELLTAVLIKP
jgi:hypothetical protein